MRAEFIMGKAMPGTTYIPKRGEVVQYDRLGDGSYLTIRVGDGKNTVPDLTVIADYDIHERVKNLELEIEQLKKRLNNERQI